VKIEKLRVTGFRGFNELCEFVFSMGLNTLYGPNGLGKTSLAEALEWLFFGETSKLRFARSKTEFRNSLRNLHYEKTDNPFVEVDIVLADGTLHTIRRELVNDNTSKLFLDDEPIENLEIINVYQKTSPIPVVAQHALKEFIHSEPVKRWENISQMLGLESLSGFRNALTSAITQFKNANAQTLGAVTELASGLKGKASLGSLSELVQAMETFNHQKFFTELQKITVEVLGSMPEDPLAALQAEREGMASNYTALSQAFSETALTKSNNNEIPKELEHLVLSIERFTTFYPQYVAASEVHLVTERIELLKQGLSLSIEGETICPFCGESTVTAEKRAALEQEVKRHETILKLYRKSKEELGTIIDLSQKLIFTIKGIVPEVVSKADFESLIEIVPVELQEELSSLVSSIVNLNNRYDNLKTSLFIELNELQKVVNERVLDQDLLSRVVTHITDIDYIIKQANMLRSKAREIQAKIIPYLQRKALENERVELLDALIRVWRNKLVIQEGFAVQNIIKRMTELKKHTEEHEKSVTAARLAQKADDILKWYEILNPKEDIRFAGMGIKGSKSRQINLVAELYGKKANAAAMLSEAHINATGLSVYLSQIVSTYSPFKFIVFDDPVQSMDADHTIRFQTDLIGELLSQGFQVIVLSHLRTFTEELKKHHVMGMDYQYEFASYHREGPRVLERGPQLEEYLKEVKLLRKGGAEKRIIAMHLMRKALERMCKMIYTNQTGKTLPKRYESMTSSQLKEIVKETIPVEEFGKINQILRYGDPASHDDPKMEPPTEGEVDSMLTQMTKLIIKYVNPNFKLK
jgi:hypothetical protein